MKRIMIWSIFMLLFMGLPYLESCSSEEESKVYKLVDGVNVTTGKKIVDLTIKRIIPNIDYDTKNKYILKILYDTRGRLSKIIWTNGYVYEKQAYVETLNYEIVEIDYELKKISFNWGKRFNNESPVKKDYYFRLNNKGYISQIGDCSLTYDDYGYLIGVENTGYAWTLTYEEGELIRSLVRKFVKDKTSVYYMFYEGDANKGDLFFSVDTNSTSEFPNVQSVEGVMCFIAYQAGLFGKITTHCQYLSNTNETTATLTRHIENSESYLNEKTDLFVCSFVLE